MIKKSITQFETEIKKIFYYRVSIILPVLWQVVWMHGTVSRSQCLITFSIRTIIYAILCQRRVCGYGPLSKSDDRGKNNSECK